MDHLEGAREAGDVRLGFDRRVRLEFSTMGDSGKWRCGLSLRGA